MARKDYVSFGGVRIPAQGLNPSGFYYALASSDTSDGLVNMQIDFSEEDYAKGLEQTFRELSSNDTGEQLGDGTVDIDGVTGKWYTWYEGDESECQWIHHYILIPNDEMQTMMRIEYDFDGEVEDLGRYDGRIKELDEQIHLIKAKQ